MILILSTMADEHALAVARELEEMRAESKILDLAGFPQRLALNGQFKATSAEFGFGCDSETLDLDDCRAVWWRRPQPPQVSSEVQDEAHRVFAFNECQEAISGVWPSLDAFWINEPARDQVAHRKVFQLRVAQSVGLEVPATLVSNCPRRTRAFVESLGIGNVIYKTFSASETLWRETRLLRAEEADMLHLVRIAPVIFQEFVPAECDLRITIVGEEVFAAAVYSNESAYQYDFRMDLGTCRIEATSLPDDVVTGLRLLMNRLGLVYGAIDMRRRPDGRHVFLEINPGGQWLFVELTTQQPIARALARRLAQADT